ncbi:MAG: tRNA lysidine(34) synthetase TilS [Candidatus Saccharimonadales bacterium]
MKKILAVSGGVDSVVMLDLMKDDADVIVAHFDHGIRGNSDEDADFVRRLSTMYNKVLECGAENLGENCSEAYARERRYEFLRAQAGKYGGEIYTAHHADDLVESVIINILRGTGWRGLAPMMDVRVQRPLLGWSKAEIHRYAAEHGLRWRQDPTNTEDEYLRNRVRGMLFERILAKDEVEKLMALSMRQREISGEVDEILMGILPEDNRYERGWFRELDDLVALEILRAGLKKVGRAATRPQLMEFLNAVRTYETGKAFNLSEDYLLRFQRDAFVLE